MPGARCRWPSRPENRTRFRPACARTNFRPSTAQLGLGPRTTSSTLAGSLSRKLSVVPRFRAGPRVEKRVRETRGSAARRTGETPATEVAAVPAEAGVAALGAACVVTPDAEVPDGGADWDLGRGRTLPTGGTLGRLGGGAAKRGGGGNGGAGGAGGSGGGGTGTVGTVGTVTGKVGVVGRVGSRFPRAPSPNANAAAKPANAAAASSTLFRSFNAFSPA